MGPKPLRGTCLLLVAFALRASSAFSGEVVAPHEAGQVPGGQGQAGAIGGLTPGLGSGVSVVPSLGLPLVPGLSPVAAPAPLARPAAIAATAPSPVALASPPAQAAAVKTVVKSIPVPSAAAGPSKKTARNAAPDAPMPGAELGRMFDGSGAFVTAEEPPVPASAGGEAAAPRLRKAAYRQGKFDAEQAGPFPNLFLPTRLRVRTSVGESAELRAALDESRRATERALGRIFERLVVPVYLPGTSAPQAVRFFALAEKAAKEIDSGARVAPSGGVVRSAFGLLYEEMVRAAEKNPESFSPLAFLDEVARGNHPMFDKNGNVMAFDVRGVGSDFDILIDCKKEALGEIQKKIGALFADPSAERLDKREDPDDMNKAFFTIADLKPWAEQTERSVRQGGAATDLLVFDLEKNALVEPARVPGIVDDLLLGYYRYLPPLAGFRREDPVSTTLRGPRALVELPFLRLRPGDRERLNEELRAVRRDVEAGRYPSEKSIQQINKLRRNGRLSMANDAVLRAPPNTTLGLLRSIAEALERKRLSQLLDFPTEIRFGSYTPRFPLGPARTRLAEDLPAGLRRHLIAPQDFIERFTDGGFLYHGTSGQGALGILRGGFRQTEYELGLRRGTYATKNPGVADVYKAGRGGQPGSAGEYLLKLPVRRDAPFLAVDSRSLLADEAVHRRLEAEARRNGAELADWLARRYGIDFVVLPEEHVTLVKNTEALERVTLPALARDTAAYLNRARSEADTDFARLLTERRRLEASMPLFNALGIDVGRVPSLEELSREALRALPHMKDPMKMLIVYDALSPELRRMVPPDGFGGKSFAEVFAGALASDPDLAPAAFSHGYGTPYRAFEDAVASPRWPGAFKAAAVEIRDKVAAPGLKPRLRFAWLSNLALMLGETAGLPGLYDRREIADLLRPIPESSFEAVRNAAAADPVSFYGIGRLENALSGLRGGKTDLTGPSVARRLEQIASSRSIAEKLRGFEMLDFVSDLRRHYRPNPEIAEAVRKTVPLIVEPEDLLHAGTHSLLDAGAYGGGGRMDAAHRALLDRCLRAVLDAAPNAEALRDRPEVGMTFNTAMGHIVDSPVGAGPETLVLVARAHEQYGLDALMPGYWPKLRRLLAAPSAGLGRPGP